MTDNQILTTTQLLIGETNDLPESEDVKPYIQLATAKIRNRLYPFGNGDQNIPERYHMTVCELAARMYLRKGSEGEVSHNENGVNRSYANVDDADILSRIIPNAGVF